MKRLTPEMRRAREASATRAEQAQRAAVAAYRARTVEAEVDKAARLRELRMAHEQGGSG